MNIDIQPVEIDGKHYVGVIMDGDPHRYGPFPDPDEAGAAASRFAEKLTDGGNGEPV